MTEIKIGDKVRYTGDGNGHASWERRKHTDSLVLEVGETVLTVWDFEGEDTFYASPENVRVVAVASYDALKPEWWPPQEGDVLGWGRITWLRRGDGQWEASPGGGTIGDDSVLELVGDGDARLLVRAGEVVSP